MNTQQNAAPRQATRTPDLLEVLIILLISAAVIIFIFWVSSQFVGSGRFQTLPDYVVAVFKNVWTAVATGTVGIGLALLKALSSRNQPQPNYLKYIGICVVCVLLPVSILIAVAAPPPPYPAPPNVTIIDLKKADKTDFDLETAPGTFAIRYALKGSFTVHDGVLNGHLSSGQIDVPKSLPPAFPPTITRISFRTCYNDPAIPLVVRNIFPVVAKTRDSMEVSIPLTPGTRAVLPPGDFTFDLPDPKHVYVAWICAAMLTDNGSMFPAE